MKNIVFLFLVWSFLSGCKEVERPDGPYGWYYLESLTTSIPIDFKNSGQQTTEHIDNFSTCGGSDYSIYWRLNKLTPVMDFHTFIFIERENEITKEKEILRGCGLTRRIVDLRENGNIELRHYGGEGSISNNPNQFDNKIEVKSLEYFSENKTIRHVALQELYDFTSEEFVETEITYLYKYGGPAY